MVRPLSDLGVNAERWVKEVRATGEPLVLTEHGEQAAVLLEARRYEKLLEELDLLREIHVAEHQLAAGQGIPHEIARDQVLSALKQ